MSSLPAVRADSVSRKVKKNRKKKVQETLAHVFWREEGSDEIKHELLDLTKAKVDDLGDSPRDLAAASTLVALEARRAFKKDEGGIEPHFYDFACDLCGAKRLEAKGRWIRWNNYDKKIYRDVCAQCYLNKVKSADLPSAFEPHDYLTFNDLLARRFFELKAAVDRDAFWRLACWPSDKDVGVDCFKDARDELYDRFNDAHQRFRDLVLKKKGDEEADEIEILTQRSISSFGHKIALGVASCDLVKGRNCVRLFGLMYRQPVTKTSHYAPVAYEDQIFLRLGNGGVLALESILGLCQETHMGMALACIADQYRIDDGRSWTEETLPPFTSSIDVDVGSESE